MTVGGRSYALKMNLLNRLFNEFLGFEVSSQVQHLPNRKTGQTAHAENTKVKHF
jgi:hypothetical protein